MTFTLTAESLADALEPHLDGRPEVHEDTNGFVVADPLPLRVVVQESQIPQHIDVRCFVVLTELPLGVAFMAANHVSLGSDCAARARVVEQDGELALIVDNGFCGPVIPGQDFAVAVQSVLQGVELFGKAAAHYGTMVAAADTGSPPAAEAGSSDRDGSTEAVDVPQETNEPAAPAAALTPGYL